MRRARRRFVRVKDYTRGGFVCLRVRTRQPLDVPAVEVAAERGGGSLVARLNANGTTGHRVGVRESRSFEFTD